MIRKTELTDKIEAVIKDGGYDERLSYLLHWAESLPDDVPQVDTAQDLSQKADGGQMMQMVNGIWYPAPMPVQPKPSVLEVALRIYITHAIPLNLQWQQCMELAFDMVDEFRAEEARRAGK